jgi:RNA polymerase sigma factor for flagellar operon FliA
MPFGWGRAFSLSSDHFTLEHQAGRIDMASATISTAVRTETTFCLAPAIPAPPAEEAAVTANLGLVRFIAARIAASLPVHVELEDLVQTGTLGLIDAVRRYDPSKGIPFPAYARYRIRGSILDSLRALDWATRNQRKQRKAMSIAASQEGPPEPDTRKLRFFSLGPVASLSTRHETQDDLPAPDVACGENLHPDKLYEAHEARELIRKALVVLPARHRRVVLMYYSGDWSMRAIGRTLGVNESRVSQIHKSALDKMKRALSCECPADSPCAA